MQGHIQVRSAPGRGSLFSFTVRLKKSLPTTAAPLRHWPGTRALVVDANATLRQLLGHRLRSWGMEVTTVARSETSLTLLQGGPAPFHLLLVDQQMPGLDGLSLAELLLQTPSPRPRPKVVLFSYFGARLAVAELESADIALILPKPIRFGELNRHLATLPLPSPLGAGTGPGRDGRPIRILLAEENPVNAKVALLQLRKLGHTATVVPSGPQALEALDREEYDLVLMDCHLPELDGYAMAREIRSRERFARVRLIAMTPGMPAGERERCREAGMDDYISKPVVLDQLKVLLQRHEPRAEP